MTDHDAVKQTIDILNRSDLLDEIEDFIEMFQKKRIVPLDILGYDLYSYAYAKAKKFKKAVEYGELALNMATTLEQKVAIMANLSKLYLNANEPVKAKQLIEFVLDHVDDREIYLLDYSAILFACGLKDQSFDIVKHMSDNLWRYDQRTSDSILFNMGVHYIRNGDFKLGMEHLAIGRKLKVFGSYASVNSIPEWDGKSYPGKHILMVGEGGLGDEIINVRFAKHIQDMGMRVSMMTNYQLKTSYSHFGFETIITSDKLKQNAYDFWTPVMSLPKTLNLDFSDLWYGPYLKASDESINKFKSKITGDFKVGIRWAGNPRYDHELHRTINLKKVEDCIDDKNWKKYSIQRDVGLEQLTNSPDVVDLSNELTTFDDLLGCLANLDLIITSCTSVAHVAAALGKRVIVMVPIMEYYIWAEGNKHSSWYGDRVTIIRQVVPNNWDQPYSELHQLLINYDKT